MTQKLWTENVVLKLFEAQKLEHSKLKKKYQVLLKQHGESRQKEENLIAQLKNIKGNLEECEKKKGIVQLQYNELQKEYADLHVTYSKVLNSSMIKYQSDCKEIADTTEMARKVDQLQSKIKSLKAQLFKKVKPTINDGSIVEHNTKVSFIMCNAETQTTILNSAEEESFKFSQSKSELENQIKMLAGKNTELNNLVSSQLDTIMKQSKEQQNTDNEHYIKTVHELESKLQAATLELQSRKCSAENETKYLRKTHEKEKKNLCNKLSNLTADKHKIEERMLNLKNEHEVLKIELEGLKLENQLICDVSLSENNKEGAHITVCTMTDENFFDKSDSELVEGMLDEMIFIPNLLSPMSVAEIGHKMNDTLYCNETNISNTSDALCGQDTAIPTFINTSTQTTFEGTNESITPKSKHKSHNNFRNLKQYSGDVPTNGNISSSLLDEVPVKNNINFCDRTSDIPASCDHKQNRKNLCTDLGKSTPKEKASEKIHLHDYENHDDIPYVSNSSSNSNFTSYCKTCIGTNNSFKSMQPVERLSCSSPYLLGFRSSNQATHDLLINEVIKPNFNSDKLPVNHKNQKQSHIDVSTKTIEKLVEKRVFRKLAFLLQNNLLRNACNFSIRKKKNRQLVRNQIKKNNKLILLPKITKPRKKLNNIVGETRDIESTCKTHTAVLNQNLKLNVERETDCDLQDNLNVTTQDKVCASVVQQIVSAKFYNNMCTHTAVAKETVKRELPNLSGSTMANSLRQLKDAACKILNNEQTEEVSVHSKTELSRCNGYKETVVLKELVDKGGNKLSTEECPIQEKPHIIHTDIYDAEQKSVDSGFVRSDSEGSEILSLDGDMLFLHNGINELSKDAIELTETSAKKNASNISRVRLKKRRVTNVGQQLSTCTATSEYKKQKIELFGAESESSSDSDIPIYANENRKYCVNQFQLFHKRYREIVKRSLKNKSQASSQRKATSVMCQKASLTKGNMFIVPNSSVKNDRDFKNETIVGECNTKLDNKQTVSLIKNANTLSTHLEKNLIDVCTSADYIMGRSEESRTVYTKVEDSSTNNTLPLVMKKDNADNQNSPRRSSARLNLRKVNVRNGTEADVLHIDCSPKGISKKVPDVDCEEYISFKRPVCRIQNLSKFSSINGDGGLDRIKEAALEDPLINRLTEENGTEFLQKLINFPSEAGILEETVQAFIHTEPSYIAKLVLDQVTLDRNDKADKKYSPPAPLMTDTQRILLGLMAKLEKAYTNSMFNAFVTAAEQRLLMERNLECVSAITRLYLAVCKLQHDIHRIRRMCCDALYFMEDLAVPFIFIILTSWGECLPIESNSGGTPLTKLIVQIIHLKTCNKPGYNLPTLRNLLSDYYGYPKERWNSDEMFSEYLKEFLERRSVTSTYAIYMLCKNLPNKWAFQKIDQNMKPLVISIKDTSLVNDIITLVTNITVSFSTKTDACMIKNIELWLEGLCRGVVPDVVQSNIILCLKKFPKLN